MSQKVANSKTVVIGFSGDLKTSTSFNQRIDVNFTPDVMFVRHIGFSSATDYFVQVKSTLHSDTLGGSFSGGGYNPGSCFVLGKDVSNTYSFNLYNIAGNDTFTGGGYVAITLEFVKYESK